MCGLFGILNVRANLNSDDFLKDAFLTSMVRGVDSSGIAGINLSSNRYDLHKLPVNGMFFAQDNFATSIMESTTKARSMAICHVRHATVGKVSLSNAHPFEVEGTEDEGMYVGAHNGTLTNWASKKDGKYFNVDSEWALHRIANDGIDAFKDFTGAYAFTWWGGKEESDKLFMARNNQRPLHIVFLDNGGMAWASEAGMLYWLLERNNIKMDGPVLSLDEGFLYSFPVGNPKEFTKESLPKPYYTPPATTYTGGSYSSHTSYSATTVDRVEALVQKIMEAHKGKQSGTEDVTSDDEEGPVESGPTFPFAKEEEIEAARKSSWLGAEVEFVPVYTDDVNNIMMGDAKLRGYTLDGLIRGDYRGEFNDSNVWICRVEGVSGHGANMTLILGKPLREYAQEDWESDWGDDQLDEDYILGGMYH